ncbi:DUF2304 domain-containing protein [Pseudodesulfovibrio tunisiensis]|uniref:DUF2304 domain-containing protein n=1 Tax=Pseudodesulfovibrio tunisiensis TaxID=463192 RepID=UPI001FB1FD99|nr:DUF2304 domain-containing protein [Pseudodesulfovibrio tunisiensis]
MIDYTITTAILGVSTVVVILFLIKKHAFYVRYTFWWFAVCAAILVFSLFPRLSDVLVGHLGISYPPALLFFGAILMLFIKTLFIDIDRSRQEVRIRRLIQRLAMLEAEMAGERKTTVREDR